MKIAQSNNPLITTPIRTEAAIKGVWNKYFANKHASIINQIRVLLRAPSNDKTKMALLRVFPLSEDLWKTFAYMPLDLSLEKINECVERLSTVPELHSDSQLMNAVNLYIQQYKMLIAALEKNQGNQKENVHKVQNQSAANEKIKEVQKLLSIDITGVWDDLTNNTFLNWLNKNGWGRYIRKGRFAGTLDAAIEILSLQLIKKPDVKTVPIEEGLPPLVSDRRSNRLILLKKIFN